MAHLCTPHLLSMQIFQEPFGRARAFRIIAPPQVQISEDVPLLQAEAMMTASGMKPPLIVKPVWTDGREGSHGLAVVYDMVGQYPGTSLTLIPTM